MEEQNIIPFPYKFTEISDEEKANIAQMFDNFVLKYYDQCPEPCKVDETKIRKVVKAGIYNARHKKIIQRSDQTVDLVRIAPKGYMICRQYSKEAENIYNMPLRPSDVFVASYQRSGTTWTQELVWLLVNDLDYATAAKIPLNHRYFFLEFSMYFPDGCVEDYVNGVMANADNVDRNKLLEIVEFMATPAPRMIATAPSPRFVKTHVPMSLLPPKILDTTKVVYVARDPRDVAVSSYHQAQMFKMAGVKGPFKEFWNLFHRSLFTLTPYFEHVKEAWAKRHEPNMLFLFYEELSKDLPAAVRRVADFFGKQLNEEQMSRLIDHLSIDNFKKNKSINYEDLREYGLLSSEETFIRKGKVGGWRNYFDEEMTQQAEQWIADNLRDTDLRFPHIN